MEIRPVASHGLGAIHQPARLQGVRSLVYSAWRALTWRLRWVRPERLRLSVLVAMACSAKAIPLYPTVWGSLAWGPDASGEPPDNGGSRNTLSHR